MALSTLCLKDFSTLLFYIPSIKHNNKYLISKKNGYIIYFSKNSGGGDGSSGDSCVWGGHIHNIRSSSSDSCGR